MTQAIAPQTLEDPFNPQHPPPTPEIAEHRIEVCEIEIAQIETQINLNKPEDYADNDTYRHWRSRAVRAIGHYRAEIRFLQRWIWKQKQANQTAQPISQEPDSFQQTQRDAKIAEAKERIAAIIAEAAPGYVPQYNEHKVPGDLEAARNRRAVIAPIYAKVCEAFAGANTLVSRCGASNKERDELRAPLADLRLVVESELKIVNAAITRYSEEAFHRENEWLVTLADGLERARSEGFILSSEERFIIERLRRNRRPTRTASAS